MSNLIIAIAAWCGVPNQYPYTSPSHINACRQELFACTAKNPAGTNFIKCFKKQELGK